MTNLGSFLKELRGERSFREMEKITGLSHTYLSSLEKGVDPRSGSERKPTPSVLKQLSEKLSIDYSTLMEAAGYLPEAESMTIGEYIKRERNFSRMSLRKFAFVSGVSHPYLSQLENERNTSPSREVIWKMAMGLKNEGKSADEFYNEMIELVGYGKSVINPNIDLSSISIDELLAEIKRRMK